MPEFMSPHESNRIRVFQEYIHDINIDETLFIGPNLHSDIEALIHQIESFFSRIGDLMARLPIRLILYLIGKNHYTGINGHFWKLNLEMAA